MVLSVLSVVESHSTAGTLKEPPMVTVLVVSLQLTVAIKGSAAAAAAAFLCAASSTLKIFGCTVAHHHVTVQLVSVGECEKRMLSLGCFGCF